MKVMKEEMNSIIKNNTWKLFIFPIVKNIGYGNEFTKSSVMALKALKGTRLDCLLNASLINVNDY